MTPILRTGIILAALMFAATALAVVLRPSSRVADEKPSFSLEKMIPEQFGDWRADRSVIPVQVSPDVQAELDKIYNQTLARTYVNSGGERVMLSIAYGGDQTDSLSVHLPEGCYGGQGFAIQEKIKGKIATAFGNIPVARLVASKGARVEPITYWLVSAGKVSNSSWNTKLAKLAYSIKGKIPDGMLVRISSISPDASNAYELQRQFSNALLSSMSPEDRERLVGQQNQD